LACLYIKELLVEWELIELSKIFDIKTN
jgi:hypothetical protein